MEDSLRQLLSEHRVAIVERWRERIFDTYSKDGSAFMRSEKDPFANPVGGTIARASETMIDGLLSGRDLAEVAQAVDDICRLRAVQSFSPAQAVAFLVQLKDVVRAELGASSLEAESLRGLLAFESRVDQLLLLAFDTYSRCRERIFEIRATELRSRSERILNRLNERLSARSAAPDEEQTPGPVGDGKRGGTT